MADPDNHRGILEMYIKGQKRLNRSVCSTWPRIRTRTDGNVFLSPVVCLPARQGLSLTRSACNVTRENE